MRLSVLRLWCACLIRALRRDVPDWRADDRRRENDARMQDRARRRGRRSPWRWSPAAAWATRGTWHGPDYM